MNKTIIFTSAAILWFGSKQCSSNDLSWDARFYTTNGASAWRLYIDGKSAGSLPYIDEKPGCDNSAIKRQGIAIHLESGTYRIDVKDPSGKTAFSGSITIIRNSSHTKISSTTSMHKAGVEMASNNECLVNKIYF